MPPESNRESKKRRVLTGIKPTGMPHIGNYLGAIQPAIELASSYDSFLFIADLHALTAFQPPVILAEQTLVVAATWLAFGLDPSRVVFYKQSDIKEIPMLAWILSCVTPLGLLNRAHSIKDARAKGVSDDDMNHGTFAYPVLMAADILLFDADVVPVGKDQKQHLEIAQEAARRFNNAYGQDLLRVPEPLINESVMTVPGLDGRKMSKSYDNTIEMFIPDKELEKKVKSIKTNSTPFGSALSTDQDTVFNLYKLFASPEETQEIARRYSTGRKDPNIPDSSLSDPIRENGFGYGDAKKALSKAILDRCGDARREYIRLMDDKVYLRRVLAEGALKAQTAAEAVLRRVTDAVGIVR